MGKVKSCYISIILLGVVFVVTKPQQAQAAAERFRRYVQLPVLTHVDLEFADFETYDVEPPAIPDLFAERPVIVLRWIPSSHTGEWDTH